MHILRLTVFRLGEEATPERIGVCAGTVVESTIATIRVGLPWAIAAPLLAVADWHCELEEPDP